VSKILVVDDDADLGELWAMALTIDGHDVTVAPDGSVALAAYDRYHPDLVILDLELPKVHGLALITKLRAMQPDLTIVAVSGRERQLRLARPLGASIVLPKPVRIVELIAVTRRVLRTSREDTLGGQAVGGVPIPYGPPHDPLRS
jgi:DNA-binding response OmpR family regulator